jgi:hypothetical protein
MHDTKTIRNPNQTPSRRRRRSRRMIVAATLSVGAILLTTPTDSSAQLIPILPWVQELLEQIGVSPRDHYEPKERDRGERRPGDATYVHNDGQPSPHRKRRPKQLDGSPLPDPDQPVPTVPRWR